MMNRVRVLLIDNYDSFTYNLYHLLASIDRVAVTVKRNDEDYLYELQKGIYDAVIIGPGPGSPTDPQYFGNCLRVIQDYGTKGLPVFGICLGFQGIAHAFQVALRRAKQPMHGKVSQLAVLKKDSLFAGVPNHISVMRYHSLMVDPVSVLDSELVVTAEVRAQEESVRINGREIMAFEHRTYPIFGVQYHPESFATEAGYKMMCNFLQKCN